MGRGSRRRSWFGFRFGGDGFGLRLGLGWRLRRRWLRRSDRRCLLFPRQVDDLGGGLRRRCCGLYGRLNDRRGLSNRRRLLDGVHNLTDLGEHLGAGLYAREVDYLCEQASRYFTQPITPAAMMMKTDCASAARSSAEV